MNRLNQLDSLRGVAALAVMFSHYLIVYPKFCSYTYDNDSFWLVNIMKYTPLHLFWSGHESVILFFILSGFVLSLPFYSQKPFHYPSYIIKRICRIYIPYISAVFTALLLKHFFYSGKINNLSDWFNGIWSHGINWTDISNHLMLIGYYKNYIYDPVFGSLVHEMRISIIFPVLMFFILRFNWKWNLLGGLILAYESVSLHEQATLSSQPQDYYLTFLYVVMFIIGAILAQHRTIVSNWYRKLHVFFKWFLFVLAIGFYTSKWTFLFSIRLDQKPFFITMSITIGAALFIIIAFSSRKVSSILIKKPIHFIGEISYSLYLFHTLVLLSFVHLLSDYLPIFVILFLSAIVSIFVAAISYEYIEKPSIKLGRYLANLLKTHLNPKPNLSHIFKRSA